MLWLPLLAMPGPFEGDRVGFFIGTYTSPDGSQGIYHAWLNTLTGEISEPTLSVKQENPSYLAMHPSGKFLYSVRETSDGETSAYAIAADQSLKLLNTQPSRGDAPCHLVVDPLGKNLLIANYGDGTLSVYPVKGDGSLAESGTVFQNQGIGPNKNRQKGPHMHGVSVDRTNRFAYACDLGTDDVLIFRLDADKGVLSPAEPGLAKVPLGSGARHVVLNLGGEFLYVNNELSNTVTVFRRDVDTGALTEIQNISTVPDGFSGNSGTAEIVLHPNGRYLYVSNRGHDSIAAYDVTPDGELKLVQIMPTLANPRGFAIDPSGRWLVVGGQDTHTITAHAIDGSSGRLSEGPNTVSVKTPVCILFATQ